MLLWKVGMLSLIYTQESLIISAFSEKLSWIFYIKQGLISKH